MDLVSIERYFANNFSTLSGSERSIRMVKIALQALALSAVAYLAVINPHVRLFTIGMSGVGIVYQLYQNRNKTMRYVLPRRRLKPPTKHLMLHRAPKVIQQSPSQTPAAQVSTPAPKDNTAPPKQEPVPAPKQDVAPAPVVQEPVPAPKQDVVPVPVAQEPAPPKQDVVPVPVAQEPAPPKQDVAPAPVAQEPVPAPKQDVAPAPVAQEPVPAPKQDVAPAPVAQEPAPQLAPAADQAAAQATPPAIQVEEDFLSFDDFVVLENSRPLDLSRSFAMGNRLARVREFDPNKMEMNIKDVKHIVVTSATTNFAGLAPLVSCGANQREMILLNPCSEKLEITYRYFCELFVAPGVVYTKPQVFRRLTACMQQVFLHANFQKTFEFIERRKRGDGHKINGEPCIPIEDFIDRRHGVCRHHSLVAAYLIDRFLLEYPEKWGFEGKVQIMRDKLDGQMTGGHAWLSFSSKEGNVFLIDTLNNYMGDLADAEFHGQMVKVFGSGAIEKHKRKAVKIR